MAIGLEAVSDVAAQSGRADNVQRTSTPAGAAAPVKQSADEIAVRKAREDFTAMILQNFLEAAIPKDLTGSDSPGAANSMYRSLLVEQLAKSVAVSGQFNVFNDVADQRLVEAKPLGPASDRHADKANEALK
ncbi:MAG: hypothetical protein JXQ99_05375 [Hyphomicrobiaceae bacterium]